jgi:hypothetical protein
VSYETVTESKVAVETEGSDVHWRVRKDDELLADVRLTPNQAVYFASQLIAAANEANRNRDNRGGE